MKHWLVFVCMSLCSFLFLREETASAGSACGLFIQPPTPICGSPLFVNVGDTLGFTVQVGGGDIGNLSVSGLPAGATMTPSLPIANCANCSSAFSWTPTPGQVGTHVVTFQIVNCSGEPVECSLTIEVEGVTPIPTFTGLGGSIFSLLLIGIGVYLVGRRQRLAE